MSDDVVIKGYADLISDSKLRGDDPDVVGRELQELGGDTDYLVAWLPDWLVDEKDVDDDRKERAEERRERREERDDPDDQDDRDQEDVDDDSDRDRSSWSRSSVIDLPPRKRGQRDLS